MRMRKTRPLAESDANRDFFCKQRDMNPGVTLSLEFGMLKLSFARTKCSQIPEMRCLWCM